MKFGLQYHEHMLAKWAAHYVDYNGLRAQIRANAGSDPVALTKVVEELEENIRVFEDLRVHGYASLRKAEHKLELRFFALDGPVYRPANAKLCDPELRFFRRYYEDVLSELRDLQAFNYLNETAVLRLFDKLIAYEPSQAKKWENKKSSWHEKQIQANNLARQEWLRIFDAVRELQQADPSDGVRSLGLSTVMSYQRPEGFDADKVYQLCVNDDASLVSQFIQECSAPGFHRGASLDGLVGDLLILAMLLESHNTRAMLLSCIMKQKLQLTVHHISIVFSLWRTGPKKPGFSEQLAEALCSTGAVSASFGGQSKIEKHMLHFAAQFEYVELFELFASRASERESRAAEALLLRDGERKTPLHYAVLSKNARVFSIMYNMIISNDVQVAASELATLFGELLLLAVRANCIEIVEIILQKDVYRQFASFELGNALYVASQSGNLRLASILSHYLIKVRKSLDAQTKYLGWSSLMVACANGHKKVASHLLAAGANPELQDYRGWTAQEHAAFRGHLAISELSALFVNLDEASKSASLTTSLVEVTPTIVLPGQKAIIVNLGSIQGGHGRQALQLPENDTNNSHNPRKPSALMLEIAMPSQGSYWVPVPLLQDYTNEPFVFIVNENTIPQLILRLYSWTSAKHNELLSGGTVILGQDSAKFGPQRESMLRETTVFMMEVNSLNIAGTVLLSYVIAQSFSGLESSHSVSCRRQAREPPRLIGHRGLGQNTASQSHLQLGENTAMSFLSAAELGASFVEYKFDLQITRDLEQVIFHDFSLSELGTDVPIHDVTLAQYKHASSLQGPQETLAAILEGDSRGKIEPRQRQRTYSTGEESTMRSLQLKERLLYTVDFQNKGFKPNTRGHSIQDTLATLDELLVKLPEDVGFNIEMKYPRLHEALEAGVAPVSIEMNTFIDVALEKLQRLAGQRPIILSSFTPEMCILLSLKQKAYPVMFITNAGKVPMADKDLRAASLQMGVHFARRWNLDGIVLACETFLHCPRLIKFVKNAGLVCASYGLPNNQPANARLQADAGIDIIIADKVRLIAGELGINSVK